MCTKIEQDFGIPMSEIATLPQPSQEQIQEIEIPDTLSMVMPQDYVDYVQISRIDSLGVEHHLYPMRFTSIPSESIAQDNQGKYLLVAKSKHFTCKYLMSS